MAKASYDLQTTLTTFASVLRTFGGCSALHGGVGGNIKV
jgi:hypothetical protein